LTAVDDGINGSLIVEADGFGEAKVVGVGVFPFY
jgi:hypothetical protein